MRGRAFGLEQEFVPVEPEPAQILDDPRDMPRARTHAVDVLDPQEEPSPAAARRIMHEERRIGMTEVQPPGRRGGEARIEPLTASRR